MVTRDFQGAPKRDIYRILSSLIIPRPIAWITTADATGRVNLAPFSSFMGIFGPPMVAVTLGRRPDGSLKDTHRNLRERGEAVVHLADLPLLEALHASAADPGPEVSEVARLGLTTEPSRLIAPPRLAEHTRRPGVPPEPGVGARPHQHPRPAGRAHGPCGGAHLEPPARLRRRQPLDAGHPARVRGGAELRGAGRDLPSGRIRAARRLRPCTGVPGQKDAGTKAPSPPSEDVDRLPGQVDGCVLHG